MNSAVRSADRAANAPALAGWVIRGKVFASIGYRLRICLGKPSGVLCSLQPRRDKLTKESLIESFVAETVF